MAEDLSFSKRYNHLRSKPINVRDEAPSEFRTFVLEALQSFYPYPQAALKLVCLAVGKIPYSIRSNIHASEWRNVVVELVDAPWFLIYDVVERLHKELRVPNSNDQLEFTRLINIFFEENGYSYRLTSLGKIEYRGEESFEVAVLTASMALQQAGLETARKEIHKALEDLSKRPQPDLTGAVQHAMTGLECAAKEIASEPKLELGKVVKQHPDLFPQPLGDVILKLYGYASNHGRHLLEGREPDVAEVELIVGVATTAATYLARKKLT